MVVNLIFFVLVVVPFLVCNLQLIPLAEKGVPIKWRQVLITAIPILLIFVFQSMHHFIFPLACWNWNAVSKVILLLADGYLTLLLK
jgi:hypothetical protein